MTETILIFDEAEARVATEQQMRLTARRYGLGGQGDGPTTEVGGPRPLPPQPPQRFELSDVPDLPPQPAWTAAVTDHLLLTPTSRAGQLRLVRMHGPQKLASWTVAEEAATTVAAILAAFGISLTDLREEEVTDE